MTSVAKIIISLEGATYVFNLNEAPESVSAVCLNTSQSNCNAN